MVIVILGGGLISLRHVKRKKVRVGSIILLHEKLDSGIKSAFGTMSGWTITSLNIFSPGCISFPWTKERWWAR